MPLERRPLLTAYSCPQWYTIYNVGNQRLKRPLLIRKALPAKSYYIAPDMWGSLPITILLCRVNPFPSTISIPPPQTRAPTMDTKQSISVIVFFQGARISPGWNERSMRPRRAALAACRLIPVGWKVLSLRPARPPTRRPGKSCQSAVPPEIESRPSESYGSPPSAPAVHLFSRGGPHMRPPRASRSNNNHSKKLAPLWVRSPAPPKRPPLSQSLHSVTCGHCPVPPVGGWRSLTPTRPRWPVINSMRLPQPTADGLLHRCPSGQLRGGVQPHPSGHRRPR